MNKPLDEKTRPALFEYLLRLGDDQLILGQRLAEWCGHGPILEEDIALTNISLDCFGQAEALLALAGEVEGKGRNADRLAYFRDEWEFRNLQLLEQPRGDFGETIVRQFLFDAMAHPLYTALQESAYEPLAAIAAKAVKEVTYHLRHARGWMVRLGDGTDESRRRVQQALERQWPFTGELFFSDDRDWILIQAGIIPDPAQFRPIWTETVTQTLAGAQLTQPEEPAYMAEGARLGRHSEHLGHMLAQLQILARSHPQAKW